MANNSNATFTFIVTTTVNQLTLQVLFTCPVLSIIFIIFYHSYVLMCAHLDPLSLICSLCDLGVNLASFHFMGVIPAVLLNICWLTSADTPFTVLVLTQLLTWCYIHPLVVKTGVHSGVKQSFRYTISLQHFMLYCTLFLIGLLPCYIKENFSCSCPGQRYTGL